MADTKMPHGFGSPRSRIISAGPSFCAAPDPLLDLKPRFFDPAIYEPSLLSDEHYRASAHSAQSEDEDFMRSWRNHPSQARRDCE